MRRLFIALGLIVVCPAVWAQTPAPMHAPDGGVRERLQSLTIPPQANAPFSATVTTEWTKLLPDGSKQSNWNRRTIARDSSGRIFQERRFFTPDGNKVPTPLSELDYADPHRHEVYACKPQERTCYVYPYSMPESMSLLPAGQLPNGRGTVAREELGQQTIDGVEATGSREITTLNAKANGMEKSEPIVKEFWYSSRLGINVVTKRFDPRTGVQNFVVSGIHQAEPDPKLFDPPAGYRIVKMESMGGAQ
ncbi:MAG TPA: hypothetical protein VK593_06100 [Edaphobacter sp.]|nr:hypothetical protein [Edaphobacter sp.]